MFEYFLSIWFFLAILLSVWTLVAFVAGRVSQLGSAVPSVLSLNLVLAVSNPKDNYLYQRPSFKLLAVFLLLSWIPVVNMLFSMLYLYLGYCVLATVGKKTVSA